MRAPLALARALALTAAAAALAGCGGGEELNNQQFAESIENLAEAHEPEEREPPPPALIEISRAEVEAQLPPGAGCDFSEGGRMLFVAASERALAKVNGVPVQLAAGGPTGPTGGFWQTERFSVSIGRLADAGVPAGETTSWPARLILTDRQAEKNKELRLEGAWRCGA